LYIGSIMECNCFHKVLSISITNCELVKQCATEMFRAFYQWAQIRLTFIDNNLSRDRGSHLVLLVLNPV
jgi:hypothetical protein